MTINWLFDSILFRITYFNNFFTKMQSRWHLCQFLESVLSIYFLFVGTKSRMWLLLYQFDILSSLKSLLFERIIACSGFGSWFFVFLLTLLVAAIIWRNKRLFASKLFVINYQYLLCHLQSNPLKIQNTFYKYISEWLPFTNYVLSPWSTKTGNLMFIFDLNLLNMIVDGIYCPT